MVNSSYNENKGQKLQIPLVHLWSTKRWYHSDQLGFKSSRFEVSCQR
uniref:Uncharacterized protein n=1 Tax=Solanum lycopersicum TaxID=4081 RepID=K4BW26_SOLLC